MRECLAKNMIKEAYFSDSSQMMLAGEGGRGGSESMERRGVLFWLLNWYPKIYFLHKNPTQKYILQDFMLAVLVGELCLTNISSKNGQ